HLLLSPRLSLSLFSTQSCIPPAMTKIFLLAALALVSVCSALEVCTNENFQGDYCLFATPQGDCINIPDPCYGQVTSMKVSHEWYCRLYDNDDCPRSLSLLVKGGYYPSLRKSLGRDYSTKSIQCWKIGSGPYPHIQ
ncbi:MAG: hypothetical protein J3Q66DRAFT_342678, partial [Benniella sp.]